LVAVETIACGTPVIAYHNGAVPELLEEGMTGFIVENIEQAVEAVRKIPNVNRRRCRAQFEERFSARRMARDYVAIYEQLLNGRSIVENSLGNGYHPSAGTIAI
jgi:glycosyltransferase involved in cell wall biosynthesis